MAPCLANTVLSRLALSSASFACPMPGNMPTMEDMRAHPGDLLQLLGVVVEVELAGHHLGGEFLGFLLVDRLGGALHEPDDVAHAQDAAGDALGVEFLQCVDLLATSR